MAEQILQDFTPPAIIDAIEQNFIGYTSAYVRASGGQVHEEPELTWLYTGTLLSYYNSVIRTAITTSDPDATIKATLAFFQARHQRMSWWVMPSTRPRDLIQRLQTLGLTLGWQDTGMAIDLHNLKEPPSTPTDLTIERVEDEKTMQDWLRAFGPGFDLNEEDLASYSRLVTCVPPQQHPIGPFYLARLHGEPVAASALYCDPRVAGLCEVCTIPSARRQGIGAAITYVPLLDARAMGYRIAVLQASPMGEPVYRRLGFTSYCTLDAYCWQPETPLMTKFHDQNRQSW
ncbi:MAG TPA: GNAT family N-acetyltransferase [Ktedonobacteraceae bacterium]|nr:GNAT family N-acetyltransferase [Ktedonobacteraceae bacterium]